MTYHLVTSEEDRVVANIRHVKDCWMRTNGGYFVLWRGIFDWIGP